MTTFHKTLAFFFAFIIGVFNLDAQILNMERKRVDNDSLEYTALNLASNLSVFNRSAASDAPVNLLGFNNSLNFMYKRRERALIFIAQNDFLRINDSPFLNTGFAHLRMHFKRGQKASTEVYGQYSYDNFRRLNPRLLAGANMRFRLIDSDVFLLNFGAGPMLEFERWQHPVSDDFVQVTFLKLNSYLVLRGALSDTFEFNTIVYYQTGYDPSIGALRNRIAHSTNVLARITGKLSMNVTFEFNYEDRPIIPITPFIFSVRNGITYALR